MILVDTINGLKRSNRCAELTSADIGKTVTVMGWAAKVRDIGNLVFIDSSFV